MPEGPTFRSGDKQKRSSGRVKLNAQGYYRLKGQEWTPCTILDIAGGGLALEGKFSFYPGDVLEVKFLLEGRPLIVEVQVTNVRGRKAGCTFISLSQPDRDFIQDYMHRNFFGDKKTI
ncbi:MAG: PilZ domain-containing protein [Leptospiraceae bacterium]|nr:PilZ domain-containing protein [Leptospiraceae bacterium]MDW8306089.1 PilZ domain-containing protein [Leptospiraceae bacterium]